MWAMLLPSSYRIAVHISHILGFLDNAHDIAGYIPSLHVMYWKIIFLVLRYAHRSIRSLDGKDVNSFVLLVLSELPSPLSSYTIFNHRARSFLDMVIPCMMKNLRVLEHMPHLILAFKPSELNIVFRVCSNVCMCVCRLKRDCQMCGAHLKMPAFRHFKRNFFPLLHHIRYYFPIEYYTEFPYIISIRLQ